MSEAPRPADMCGPENAPDVHTLHRWSEALAGVARAGLAFTESLYEQERFDEILKVAADIAAAASGAEPVDRHLAWTQSIERGVAGYPTPKVAVAAIVGNERGEILLTRRADSGIWLYPVGWADIGYSPSEVAMKEAYEETGIVVQPRSLIGVLDGLRLGFGGIALYSLLFHCDMVGGDLRPHPLETSAVGFFARGALPSPLAGQERWVDLAFDAIEGRGPVATFDEPREPVWRAPIEQREPAGPTSTVKIGSVSAHAPSPGPQRSTS